jgi:hypothetical protein
MGSKSFSHDRDLSEIKEDFSENSMSDQEEDDFENDGNGKTKKNRR